MEAKFDGCFWVVISVMGLLMLTFPCGEGGTMFVDLPFEPKQHLISYHLEGQGEDRVNRK